MAIVERKTPGERAFNWINAVLLGLLTVIFLYPMWHCLMASFSEPISLIGYSGFILKPMGFSLQGYKTVLNNANIYIGYGNTFFYLIAGTAINMALTVLAGYALSRKSLAVRVPVTLLIVFTMYMDFGLIPAFLNVRQLGLYNTRWAIILPGAFAPFSVFLLTKFMRRIPYSLIEAAKIDGAGEWQVFSRVCMPQCRAALYSIAILVFIDYWNMVEQPIVLLPDAEKQPLSVYLSTINTGEVGLAFAIATIYMVPTLLLFLHGEEYLVEGIATQGSVKG